MARQLQQQTTQNSNPSYYHHQFQSSSANDIDVVIALGAGASASADCVATNNCFTPNPLSVGAGHTVTWLNGDQVSHTITSGLASDSTPGSLFDSGLIRPGETFQFTFANPGTYRLLLYRTPLDDRTGTSRTR